MYPTIATQWAPKGCQPQLFSDSNQERVNLCGFVNAKWHRSKDVKDYLAQQEHIALQFFPPYSPELNPMEWEWHELRRQATHTKRFQCNKECWQTIQDHFETRKGKNNHFICQLY